MFVMPNKMVFRASDEKGHLQDSWRYLFFWHVSQFAVEDALDGFLEHIGKENPFYQRLLDIAESFVTKIPDRLSTF